MLHDPERHEALRAPGWDATAARHAIDTIVADVERDYDERAYWPAHPQDADPAEAADIPVTPLYHGACGVLWGLRHLQARGLAGPTRCDALDLDTLSTRHRTWLKQVGEREIASYLMGDTPIRLMAFTIAPSEALATTLESLIAGNVEHPSREMLWGSPGTMLAALFLHEKTGDPRWAALFRLTAQRLWDHLEWSDESACWHWTQDMYGRRSAYLGAGHGFVGNASVLIRGRSLLSADAWSAWETRIVETVTRTALREDGRANWYARLDPPPDASPHLVQWCHGAPGFVISLAGLPGTALDALMLEAGETVWTAGPLKKGSNLCHGTGGNAYAFLKLFDRTGDPLWLDRARAFAMHGIEQVDTARSIHGRGRYSLWTGDIGFAIFLADCLDGVAAFPTLDVFWTSTGTR